MAISKLNTIWVPNLLKKLIEPILSNSLRNILINEQHRLRQAKSVYTLTY